MNRVKREGDGSGTLQDLVELKQVVEEWLIAYLGQLPIEGNLREAIFYALRSPGKRLRPILSIACADGLGIPRTAVRSIAVAVECLHASSLVHDDLPAVDNDSLRRGLPTCHVKFGEAVAVMAGNSLNCAAMVEILSNSGELTADASRRAAAELAQAFLDVQLGQVMDMEAAAQQSAPDFATEVARLEARHLYKTGALIAGALVAPTYAAAPVSDEQRRTIRSYGLKLGLLFQITDDLLDATSTTHLLGKTARADEARALPTYVSLFGIEGARKQAEKVCEEAVGLAAAVFPAGSMLLKLPAVFRDRQR